MCTSTSIKTFVDDIYPIVTANKNEDIQNKITETINEVSKYMRANKLAVNVPKMQLFIVSKNNNRA